MPQIGLIFDSAARCILDRCQKAFNCRNHATTLKKAIALLALCTEAMQQGKKIVIDNKDGSSTPVRL